MDLTADRMNIPNPSPIPEPGQPPLKLDQSRMNIPNTSPIPEPLLKLDQIRKRLQQNAENIDLFQLATEVNQIGAGVDVFVEPKNGGYEIASEEIIKLSAKGLKLVLSGFNDVADAEYYSPDILYIDFDYLSIFYPSSKGKLARKVMQSYHPDEVEEKKGVVIGWWD